MHPSYVLTSSIAERDVDEHDSGRLVAVNDMWACLGFGGGRLGQYGPVEVGDMLKPLSPLTFPRPPHWRRWEVAARICIYKHKLPVFLRPSTPKLFYDQKQRPWRTCDVEVCRGRLTLAYFYCLHEGMAELNSWNKNVTCSEYWLNIVILYIFLHKNPGFTAYFRT